MTVSGVFNSCDTLATNSCRKFSSRRRSVTSCSTNNAPGEGLPGSRRTWMATIRRVALPSSNSTFRGSLWASAS
jgi:hypothetical protein